MVCALLPCIARGAAAPLLPSRTRQAARGLIAAARAPPAPPQGLAMGFVLLRVESLVEEGKL